MTQNRKKQSIIVGALTGTAGIFITKALGLLYASPFQAMAGSEMIFYTSTYQIYEFLLTISTSGIPFAIATLVAKYMAKDDYRTTLLVRKISAIMLSLFGVLIFAAVVLFSGSIVRMLEPGRDAVYLHKYQVSLILVSFAIISVPILSIFRGFYQGLKEMKAYAFSQVLEQFVRITFLLGIGALMLYVFHKEQIWAVYAAVLSTSISAVAASIYFLFFDKKHLPELQELAKRQEKPARQTKEIVQEIFYFAVPYFLISVIANCSGMINLMFVKQSLQVFGYSAEQADTVYSIMNFNAYKLVSIPQILGPGFAVAIVPHITTCLTLEDYDGVRSNIKKIFTSCTFIAYPIILLMILYAPEIYYIMYGEQQVMLGADILRWGLLVSAVWIIMTLCSNSLMALKLKRFNLIWNIIDVLLMLALIAPVVQGFSYQGMYVLYIVLYIMFISLAFYLMCSRFEVRLLPIAATLGKIVISLIGIVAVYVLFQWLPYDFLEHGRIMAIVIIGLECVACMLGYLGITQALGLPNEVFGFDPAALLRRLRK